MSAEPVTVRKIDEAIEDLEAQIGDAAIDGEYHKAEKLSEELKDLEERKVFGEIYLINI